MLFALIANPWKVIVFYHNIRKHKKQNRNLKEERRRECRGKQRGEYFPDIT